MRFVLRASLLIGTIALPACTSFEPNLRPTLSTNYMDERPGRSTASIVQPSDLGNGASFRCVRNVNSRSGQISDAVSDKEADPLGCLYKYVQINDLPTFLKLDDTGQEANKKKMIRLVISLTRQNCNTYLSRMFANREGLTFWQKLLNDLATAGGGAAAFASPVASAVVSGANISFNHGMDAAKATYFQMAQDAFETAVQQSMVSDQKKIEKLLANEDNPYPIMNAMADLDTYGRTCSLAGGLRSVNATIQTHKDDVPGALPETSSETDLQAGDQAGAVEDDGGQAEDK